MTMDVFDSTLLDSILHDLSGVVKGNENIHSYLRSRWPLFSSGQSIASLIRNVFNKLQPIVSITVLESLLKEINWHCVEDNKLVDGMVQFYAQSRYRQVVIINELEKVLKNDGSKCPFLIWLNQYISMHGDSDSAYVNLIVKLTRGLLDRTPYVARVTVMAVLDKHASNIRKIMSDKCISLWYDYFAKNKLRPQLILTVARSAHLFCTSSTLVLIEVMNRIKRVNRLQEFFEAIDWINFSTVLFYSEPALPVIMYIFAPTVLPKLGYRVSFVNKFDSEYLPQEMLATLNAIAPSSDPGGGAVHLMKQACGYSDDADENSLKDGLSESKKLQILIPRCRKIRSLVFPRVSEFIRNAKSDLMQRKETCTLVSKVMASCRTENGIGTLLTEIAEYIATLDLFSQICESTSAIEGIISLIQENVRCDREMHCSLAGISDVPIDQLFSVPLVRGLVSNRKIDAYCQDPRGTKVLELLQTTPIPEVVSQLSQNECVRG